MWKGRSLYTKQAVWYHDFLWLRTPCSGLGWMEDFGELITLETTTHPWVWWSLGLRRGVWDYNFFHLWFLVIFYSREVLVTMLLCRGDNLHHHHRHQGYG